MSREKISLDVTLRELLKLWATKIHTSDDEWFMHIPMWFKTDSFEMHEESIEILNKDNISDKAKRLNEM